MNETQTRLIEAAEVEFARHGFEGASVRKITARARANVAAISYHFGSKESLFVEMIRYRTAPVNELRIRLFDEALAEAKGQPLPIERIVEITVRPLMESFMETGDAQFHFMRAMGRGFSEESHLMVSLYEDILKDLLEKLSEALQQSLPDLPPEELACCQHFLGCSLSGMMMQYQRLSQLLDRSLASIPVANVSDRLIAFISGGIQAVAARYREGAPKPGRRARRAR